MIRTVATLVARLAAALIFVLTWAFGITTYNAFAFDQFVRAGLSPFLTHFVRWHNAWFAAAYLLTAMTLIPLIRKRPAERRVRMARWLAIAYVAVIGGASIWLLGTPHLAMLDRDSRDLITVPGALLPLLWLSAIDHLAHARIDDGAAPTPQRTLLTATLASAAALWLLHLGAWWLIRDAAADVSLSAIAAAWALVLDVGAMLALYAALGLAAAIASGRRRPALWEHMITVAIIAIGVQEFVRRIVLPPIGFLALDSALIAIPFGIAVAATWSGLRVACSATPVINGVRSLVAMRVERPVLSLVMLAAVAVAATIAINQIERIDWAFIVQQLVAIVEGIFVFGIILPLAMRWTPPARWSTVACVAPPLLAIATLYAMPPLTSAIAARSGEESSDPQDAVDRASAIDPFARLAAAGLIARQPLDVTFYERMLEIERAKWSLFPSPQPEAMPARALQTQPHVFMFVIDSLRRDYVGAYNPAVTFTPALDAFAADADVFRNAITQYGGTWLSASSLWAGRLLPRGWPAIIKNVNTLEQLVTSTGYDLVINDFTIEPELRKETTRTFLNPYTSSPQVDMCQNVESLHNYIDTRKNTRPIFTYLGPMNLHILNTLAAEPNDHHPGFNGVYADKLQRIDACFGTFIAFLKARGIYDDSVIIVTSDHGDSLGEDGRWGHQSFMFPEIVRVPLIVRLPPAMRAAATTDLGGIATLTDLTPTLLQLFGLPPAGQGPAFGESLYVPADAAPPDRRRRTFLVMSSYGSTYGAVRRNGRDLYVADLSNWREYAYSLDATGHRRVPLSDGLRRVFQADLTAQVNAVRPLYESRASQ